jgi:hypothetical protein
MSLKITLTIDQESEQGVVLIGLLAKALGRNEAGVSDLRIEREGAEPLRGGKEYAVGRAEGLALRAVRKSTVAKLVASGKRQRSGYEPGMRAMKSGKPNSVSIILRGIKHEGSRDAIGAMLSAKGFDPKGMSPALTKLTRRGYIRNVGKGEYRLTPKGEELEGRINAKVEHHDSKND